MGIFLQVKSLSFVEDAIGAHKLEKTAFESNRAFFDHVDKIYSAVSVNYLHRRFDLGWHGEQFFDLLVFSFNLAAILKSRNFE